MGQTSGSQRLHGLDGLRAAAMELGLVLHAAVPYTTGCPATWAACDGSRSAAFDLLNVVIHAFRMPVFFLMSGFFALLVLERLGTRGFVLHRLRRIALPLAVACLTIVPLTRAVWILGGVTAPTAPPGGRFLPSLLHHFREEGLRVFETVWHLWFLEYLLIFYVALLGVRELMCRLPSTARATLRTRLEAALLGRGRALWLALPTALLMLPMAGWNVDGVSTLRTPPHMLAYYGLFFAAGALLHGARDRLPRLERDWRAHLLLALGVVLPGMLIASRVSPGASPAVASALDLLGRGASALLTTLLAFGVTGLFLARFGRPSARQRYLADAAYWIYLTHFPLIALLGVAARGIAAPALLEYGAILAVAFGALLAAYGAFVRHGAVGRVLHGPR